MKYDILETKERVLADNDVAASELRKVLKEKGIFFINLMASPGAGKTTLLKRTIQDLKDDFKFGIMEADVDSDVDAAAISELGVPVIQLHSGGLCHMDADMTARGIDAFLSGLGAAPKAEATTKEDTNPTNVEGLPAAPDILILENIGNLVCPAEFDVGANKRVMILSVPEGHDKPLKYPLMFQVSDLIIVNKIDTKVIFDFSEKEFEKNVRIQNPNAPIMYLSAKTGEGFNQWKTWLAEEVRKNKSL